LTFRFPCASTAALLIKCGADVNAKDKNKNTPLHVIAGYKKSVNDLLTLHGIISRLIENGAHIDYANIKGETPSESAAIEVSEIILKLEAKINLMCLAARAVHRYSIDYKNKVPLSLINFIEDHGFKMEGSK
jgi:protein fem-1-like protein B